MPAHRWVAGLLAATIVPLLSSLASAQATDFIGGHVKQWWPEIESGHVVGNTSVIAGTDLKLREEIDLLRENSGFTDLALWGKFPMIPFRVMFSTYGGGFDDGRVLEETESFEGQVYPAGTTIHGELAMRAYTLMFDFGLGTPSLYQSSIQFGVQVGVQFMDHEIDISAIGFPKVDERWETAIPMLGARASIRLGGLFEIAALVQGIQTAGLVDAFDGSVVDFNAELRWWATPGFAFGFGYRAIQIQGEDDDGDELHILIHGFYVSIVFQY